MELSAYKEKVSPYILTEDIGADKINNTKVTLN